MTGRPNLLIAEPGIGKTQFALWICCNLIFNRPAFTNWAPRAGNVLWLNCEMSPEKLNRRMVRMANSLGEDRQKEKDITFLSHKQVEPFLPRNRSWKINLINQIKLTKANLCVIDTLSKFCPGDENDNQTHPDLLGELEKITAETGCVFWSLHHCKKGSKTTYRGASGIAASVETILSLDCTSKDIYRVRTEKMADGEKPEFGFKMVGWGVEPLKLVSLEEAETQDDESKIIKALRENGKPMSKSALIEAAFGSRSRAGKEINALLDRMELEGKIISTGKTHKNHKTYSLPND